jgi:hypothetical protein
MNKMTETYRFVIRRQGLVLAIAAVLVFIWGTSSSWEYNKRYPFGDWHTVLRADAAGYYSYLPGLFQYGFEAHRIDSVVMHDAGGGFKLDRARDRLVTKCFYGPAVLELPFYLIAEGVVGWGSTSGFTGAHSRAIEAGGIFYWVLGLWLLACGLRKWRPAPLWVQLVVLALISFGTNVFYYAFRMPGYSHIYSFVMVCLALRCMVGIVRTGGTMAERVLFWFACAMIFWIRPVDLIALAAIYAWLWLESRATLLSWRFWSGQAIMLLIIAIPQLLYWHYAYGSAFTYAYGEEGFKNWDKVDLFRQVFAPSNGLLLYAPPLLLLPLGLWTLRRHQPALPWTLAGMFIAIIYACASWHSWHFGCSFGQRPMVQYMPFLAVACWTFFLAKSQRAYGWRCAMLPLMTLLCYVNYRVSLQYSGCSTLGEWNWSEYVHDVLDAFFGSKWL